MKIACPNCRRYVGELVAGQFLSVHGGTEILSYPPVSIRCRCGHTIAISPHDTPIRYNATKQQTEGLRAAPTATNGD